MRIPIHAVLPVTVIFAVVWCLRWHFREEARKRELHAAIARELRDNAAIARLREAERASRANRAADRSVCHHQIEPFAFDIFTRTRHVSRARRSGEV